MVNSGLMRRDQAQARRERSDVSPRKRLKIRRINIVHHGDGIVVAGNVVARNANGPLVFMKFEPFFYSKVQAEVCWESQRICASYQLLLVVYDAVRKTSMVLHEITA
jgi:hypothetical protein